MSSSLGHTKAPCAVYQHSVWVYGDIFKTVHVATLPPGTEVEVRGPSIQGVTRIVYDGDWETDYRIDSRCLAVDEASGTAPYYFWHVSGRSNLGYPAGSLVTSLGDAGRNTWAVAGVQGQVENIHRKDFGPRGFRFFSLPWDFDANQPICKDIAEAQPLNALYSRAANAVAKSQFAIGLILCAVVVLHALSATGAQNWKRLWWLLASLLFLFAMTPSARTMRSLHACSRAQLLIENHQTSHGYVKPLLPDQARILLELPDAERNFASGLPWALLACLFPARLAYSALRGAHYLMVPHPAERFVRAVGSGTRGLRVDYDGLAGNVGKADAAKPPPEFVSENQTRRARKLTELFRAERHLAEEAVRHARGEAAQRKEGKTGKR